MNTLWRNIYRRLINLKNACLEELWILGLFLPVIALVIVGLLHFNQQNNQYVLIEVVPKTEHKTQPKPQPNQLSDKQVAVMVELPLDKLLDIPVYFDEDNQTNASYEETQVALITPLKSDLDVMTGMDTSNDIQLRAFAELAYHSKRNRKDQALTGDII